MVPTSLGTAVYKARTLQGFYSAGLTYDDWDICHDAGLYKNGNVNEFGAMEIDKSLLIAQEENVLIYPNPANTHIEISYSLKLNETGRLQFFDLLGREQLSCALHATYSRKKVDISQLEKGLYVYKYLVNEQQVAFGKLIKD
jgi:hypothetical protein